MMYIKIIRFVSIAIGVFLFSLTDIKTECYAAVDNAIISGKETGKSKSEIKIPLGMENIRIGNVNHIVPIGTKVERKGDILIFESRGELMARKFLDFEVRFKNIEEEIKKLSESIISIQEKDPTRQEENTEEIQVE